jgi:hypothetical protein
VAVLQHATSMAGGGDDSAAAEDVHVTPASMRTVVMEMLPFDLVAETSDQLRSGFGLIHKYQKRKKQVRGWVWWSGAST